MKLTKSQLREMIREEILTESADARNIADSFTRYLMGNSKLAVQELTKYMNYHGGSNPSLNQVGYGQAEPGTKEYNNEYKELYNAILKAIQGGF
jgi:outer membrane protein assembly factor BamD (BamD/ComL family)